MSSATRRAMSGRWSPTWRTWGRRWMRSPAARPSSTSRRSRRRTEAGRRDLPCEHPVDVQRVRGEMHRMRRVVWASSETVLGLPFDRPRTSRRSTRRSPRDQRRRTRSQSWSARRWPSSSRGGPDPTVRLRISNIMEPPDYERFPSYWDDATTRKWNLWGYVDVRDVARRRPGGVSRPSSTAPRSASSPRPTHA